MTTEKQLFSEVKNTLKSYEEANLIDDITLRMWLKSELKTFGTNVMVLTDDIIQVKNGKAKLPEFFWRLKEAWKYTPSYYKINKGDKNVAKGCDKAKQCTYEEAVQKGCSLKENVNYKGTDLDIYYDNPTILRLTRGFDRNSVEKDCINLPSYVLKKDKNEINILNNTLQTQFNNGYIYIIYRSFPTHNGEIIIPETQHDDLYKYLLTFLKLKVLEELWLNNDDPNLGNKISYLLAQSENYRSKAHTEMKAGALNPSSWKTVKRTNQLRHRKYELMTPRQNFRR